MHQGKVQAALDTLMDEGFKLDQLIEGFSNESSYALIALSPISCKMDFKVIYAVQDDAIVWDLFKKSEEKTT